MNHDFGVGGLTGLDELNFLLVKGASRCLMGLRHWNKADATGQPGQRAGQSQASQRADGFHDSTLTGNGGGPLIDKTGETLTHSMKGKGAL
jgi:hypothetical protein